MDNNAISSLICAAVRIERFVTGIKTHPVVFLQTLTCPTYDHDQGNIVHHPSPSSAEPKL